MELLNNSFAKISYQEHGHFILFEYKKFLEHTKFKKSWDIAGDFAIEKNINKWLSDSRQMMMIDGQSQKWFVETWTPRVVAEVNMPHYSAIVLSDNAFTEMTAQEMMLSIEEKEDELQPLTVRYFNDIDEAIVWLKSV
jgi:hypothetical protein